MLLNGSSGEVLCKKIRGVRGPKHLKKSKGPLAQALLNPELANRQMADTANSAPPANAYCGGAVREHLQLEGEVQVAAQGHESEPLPAGFHKPAQLCLSRAERHALLSH